MSGGGAIARPTAHAYRRGMAARLLRLLILLALVLMPVRMAAQAHLPAPAAGGAGHHVAAISGPCGDHEPPADGEKKADLEIDCMMACAALPGADQVLERLSLAVVPERPGPARPVTGRSHAADPPPPRFS